MKNSDTKHDPLIYALAIIFIAVALGIAVRLATALTLLETLLCAAVMGATGIAFYTVFGSASDLTVRKAK